MTSCCLSIYTTKGIGGSVPMPTSVCIYINIQPELELVCGLEGHRGAKRARVYHLTPIFLFKYSLRAVYKNKNNQFDLKKGQF